MNEIYKKKKEFLLFLYFFTPNTFKYSITKKLLEKQNNEE